MPSKSNGRANGISAVEEACALASELAWPGGQRPGVKKAIRDVQRITGFSARRVKALLYREARRVDPEELDILRALGSAQGDRRNAAGQTENLEAEVARLRQDFARLAEEVRILRGDR